MFRWGEPPRWDLPGARPWRGAVVCHSAERKWARAPRGAGGPAPTRRARRPVAAAATNSRPSGLLINQPAFSEISIAAFSFELRPRPPRGRLLTTRPFDDLRLYDRKCLSLARNLTAFSIFSQLPRPRPGVICLSPGAGCPSFSAANSTTLNPHHLPRATSTPHHTSPHLSWHSGSQPRQLPARQSLQLGNIAASRLHPATPTD